MPARPLLATHFNRLGARRDSYLPGVQCLARSLQAAASAYPLLVLYTPDTLGQGAVEALLREGCHMVPVERYVPPGGCRPNKGGSTCSGAEILRQVGAGPPVERRRAPPGFAGPLLGA